MVEQVRAQSLPVSFLLSARMLLGAVHLSGADQVIACRHWADGSAG